MNFNPNISVRSTVAIVVMVAVAGLIGSGSRVAPAPDPIAATQKAFAFPEPFQVSHPAPVIPALYVASDSSSAYYQPVSSWYKSKHWWKRNAPIVGGAAGGALIGGLAGGGTGALIGGAAGGGGGYLYKRVKHHNHYHDYYRK